MGSGPATQGDDASMPRKKKSSMHRTREVLDELFAHPPINEADLERRLLPIDPASARRVLTERLQRALVDEEDFGLFLEVFLRLGLGQERDLLARIALDKENDTLARTLAMSLVAGDDPDYLSDDVEGMDPQDLAELAERPLLELLANAEASADASAEITELLLGAPEEIRETLLYRLGHCRRKAGISAVSAYAHALRCPELAALHAVMIDAVVEEGGRDGVALLHELRDAATNPDERRRLQGALMRGSTKAIEPGRSTKPASGSAYVGTCDGQGAFLLLGSFRKPNGVLTTASLCIQASADIRDGFVMPRHTQRELRGIIKQAREATGSEFASISLDQAADLVAEAVERTNLLGLSIPDDAKPAVRLFQQLSREPQVNERAGTEAVDTSRSGKVSMARTRRLLDNPIHASWFFDIGDLLGSQAEPPSEDGSLKKWLEATASSLDTEPIQRRLSAMARHTAQWHAWRGEQDLAVLWAQLQQTTEKSFRRSPLVRAMLERTLQSAAHWDELQEDEEEEILGSPEVRQYLKSRFFRDLRSPRARDLALLDFVEVALLGLESALTLVPGERRPRDVDKPEIAFAVGQSFRDLVFEARRPSVEAHMPRMAEQLAQVCRMKPKERSAVVAKAVWELEAFVGEVCSCCPVACADNPDSDVADVFFSPHHPLALLSDRKPS